MKALIVVQIRNNEVTTAQLSRLLLLRGASANRGELSLTEGLSAESVSIQKSGNLTNAGKKKRKAKIVWLILV